MVKTLRATGCELDWELIHDPRFKIHDAGSILSKLDFYLDSIDHRSYIADTHISSSI